MIGLATRLETLDPQALATTIHNDILQSLGVAMLSVDLARRLHQRLRYDEALAELSGVVAAAGAALASSDRLLPDLRRYTPTETAQSARPSLVVVAAPSQTSAVRPAAGPNEIAQTLAACEVLARRCHHQYDAGLGEDTMIELGLLSQRLEFVAVAFRVLMHHLRALVGTPSAASALARTA